MTTKKTKQCIDCGTMIYTTATRCRFCARMAVLSGVLAQKTPAYDTDRPAATIKVEEIDHNTVVITAYQGELHTKLKYDKEGLNRLINRLNMGVSAVILDGKVYHSHQDGTIVINKSTLIVYSARDNNKGDK